MEALFISKLKNKEYISKHLYNRVKNNSYIVPNDFDLEKYNEEVLNRKLIEYKDYFDNMYTNIDSNINLDIEQRKAILADEDFSLIIAGAGTGKTTTISSKVKFLVDKKNVPPEEILVMSYTKASTLELEKRICYDFNIPTKVTTFHSLGYMHIREIFNTRKCYIVDNNVRRDIFYRYFKDKIFSDKDKVKEIIDIFSNAFSNWIFGKHFLNNYEKYETFDEYFEAYKKSKIAEFHSLEEIRKVIFYKIENSLNQENIFTLKNELVKSKGEAIIANFLACNGISYEYEKIYDKLMDENKIYKPDFTLNFFGEKVYIEYFGLADEDELVNQKYKRIKELKENYHLKHHNKFISISSDNGENIISYLKNELLRIGFTLRPLSTIEIYELILDANPLAQVYNLMFYFYNSIDAIKLSSKREKYYEIISNYLTTLSNDEQDTARKQANYIIDFYRYYQKTLYGSTDYGFDFGDLIFYANKYISTLRTNNRLNFQYIIIDEYQDISQERYEFTKSIAERNHAKVVAVGDDWQSIYGFSGSKIDYIYNFQKYFKDSKLLKISNTYRNSQSLINYSGEFIMRNDTQIKKNLYSNKDLVNPIKFIVFDDESADEYTVLKNLILRIYNKNPNHRIMILARNNSMINKCFDEIDLKDDIGNKITYVGYEDIMIEGMTIHKSKGLTCDEVIIIGLNNNFPNSEHSSFWLDGLFKQQLIEESIPFAEERRIFYVALTRTKNHVYLLTNRDSKKRSPFIEEIARIIKENNLNKDEEII